MEGRPKKPIPSPGTAKKARSDRVNKTQPKATAISSPVHTYQDVFEIGAFLSLDTLPFTRKQCFRAPKTLSRLWIFLQGIFRLSRLDSGKRFGWKPHRLSFFKNHSLMNEHSKFTRFLFTILNNNNKYLTFPLQEAKCTKRVAIFNC